MRNFLAKSLYSVYTEEKIVYKKFIVYTQYSRKFIQKYKNLLCIHSTVENLYKNSAVEMLHLID